MKLLPIAAFVAGLALPPAAVWFATRGHGPPQAVDSEPLRVDPGRDELHAWRWADPERRTVRLPIDRAIERYLKTAATR